MLHGTLVLAGLPAPLPTWASAHLRIGRPRLLAEALDLVGLVLGERELELGPGLRVEAGH